MNINMIAKASLVFITILGCLFMLEISTNSNLLQFELRYLILNYLTLGTLWIFLYILSNRVWLASCLCAVICAGIAVINHYAIKLHGMPLSFLLVRNFRTAMNVITVDSLTIDPEACKIVLVVLVLVIACFLVRYFFKHQNCKWQKVLIRDIMLLFIGGAIIYCGYFGGNPVKPPKTITWSWAEAYYKYGYTACTLESALQSLNVVNKPEGYSEEKISDIIIKEEKEGGYQSETPDIILILNETYYDLQQITEVQADTPYMEVIQNIDNIYRGYAVVPSVGGGTNNSEYELLTSNSLYLMPGVTPFNALNLNNANSIVSHLNILGYSSIGAHSEPPSSYARGQAYPALGFSKSYFNTDFSYAEVYHDRYKKTDESLYKDLIQWYEDQPEDTPRFIYMLTIQNHSPFDINAPEYDTVHTLKDYGSYTEQINEFLTCIDLSNRAFKGLTDYFAKSERPVIICMVGDHSPHFSSEIIDSEYEGDKELLLRKVPLIIWANYGLEQVELGTISMNYVVPTLLEMADIKLSPYYEYLLWAKESVPIITSYGTYYDSEGNCYKYSDNRETSHKEVVDNYFFLEYNNLSDSRIQELFQPYN